MFAFAIWDRARQRLLLARDRLGIKPLYYAVTDRELLFASEIKAILAAMAGRPRSTRRCFRSSSRTATWPARRRSSAGIRKLPPGHTLTWSPERAGPGAAATGSLPCTDESAATLAERGAELRGRLEDAVRSHLMSDVPLGLFLSGGIDSTGHRRPHGADGDATGCAPSPWASTTTRATSCGTRGWPRARSGRSITRSSVSPDEFFGALPRLIWHEDEPIAFPSSVPLYFVSRLARQHVKVVLTGEGADELFLGYDCYRVTAWNERLGRLYRRYAPALSAGASGRRSLACPRRLGRYAARTFLALDPGIRSHLLRELRRFPGRGPPVPSPRQGPRGGRGSLPGAAALLRRDARLDAPPR